MSGLSNEEKNSIVNWEIGTTKGIIPMNNGTPFYTIDNNPIVCGNMKSGDACNNTWRVKATGEINTTYEFFTIYNAINYPVSENITDKVNVTIINITLSVNKLECEKNGIFGNCTSIAYDDVLTATRANCTDTAIALLDVMEARFKLTNLNDNKTLIENMTAARNGDWWILDNNDISIEDSGDFELEVVCKDSDLNEKKYSETWGIPFGKLEPYMINEPVEVAQNRTFSFSTGIRCVDGECGNISAALDPVKNENNNLIKKEHATITRKVLRPLASVKDGLAIKGNDMEAVTREFAKQNLGFDMSDMSLVSMSNDILENKEIWYLFYNQYYKGIEVYNSVVGFVIINGNIAKSISNYYPDIDVSAVPYISEENALELANKRLKLNIENADSSLVVYPYKNQYFLAWKIEMPFVKEPLSRYTVFVDAQNGNVIDYHDNIIYDSLTGNVTGMVVPQTWLENQTEVPFKNNKVNVDANYN